MQFITKGKTNWKFLLVVIVLVGIVGGGTLWWVKKEIPLPELLEVKKQIEISEDRCKDIEDFEKQGDCYINLAEETKNEIWCEKIKPIHYEKPIVYQAPITKITCYNNISKIKNDPFICERLLKIENVDFPASFFLECVKYLEDKNKTTYWKTYGNVDYGFELKYPLTWLFEKNLSGPSLNYTPFYMVNIYTAQAVGTYDWEPVIAWVEVYDKFTEEINKWLSMGSSLTYTEVKKDDIYIYENGCCKKYLTRTGSKYVFGLGINIPPYDLSTEVEIPDSKYIELFDQMLSTFRFIEEEEGMSTAGELQGDMKVLLPNGGEEWKVGENHEITWESSGIKSVAIYITDFSYFSDRRVFGFENNEFKWDLKNTDEIPKIIVKDFPATGGKYLWQIPNNILDQNWKSGDDFKIYIYGETIGGALLVRSDDLFSISK